MYFSCFFPEKIPIISNSYSVFISLLFKSNSSRRILSFNSKLFFCASSSCIIIFSLSSFSICLPFIRVKTPLLNKLSFPVLFVASIENIFLNYSGKLSLSTICIPSTALILVDFANPSYWLIVSFISFIFSISLN